MDLVATRIDTIAEQSLLAGGYVNLVEFPARQKSLRKKPSIQLRYGAWAKPQLSRIDALKSSVRSPFLQWCIL